MNSSHASTVAIGRSGHKWANRVPLTTLEVVLENKHYYAMLKKFLVSIHKHAVLMLWEACQTYKLTHKQVGASKRLVALIDILENQCPGEPLKTEGLYRISGDKTKIASLIQLLQRSEYENISRQALENEISFHEITGLIKNYLRTMEEPLLLFKFQGLRQYW